ncbi:DMR6-like oxygenase 2-like protein [Tanacetum coccineum]|uniref:DMR6-like oxygenase 2-like protein n=1 Tax=Tanacetum coccineum TaxID=301880 RepID=A0ABQ5D1U5_9ASTR
MGELDPTFIQEPEHRAKLAIVEAQGIPQIDLSPLINSSPADYNAAAVQDLIGEVRDACKNWGFFQVFNHGVPLESREKLFSVSKRFYDQPMEEKRKVRRDEANPQGYYDTEHTKNVRDWKEVFDITVENPTKMFASHEADDDRITHYINRWPEHLPELREACEAYVKDVQQLSYKLLELISLSLNLPANRFEPFFCKDQTSFIRLNHYPPCPVPDLALGVGRHKDAIALTILAQDDVGGLEVKRKTDGEWIFVKPTPNTFIINVGDMIQVWSNDRYESVEHRVMVNSTRERFSIPFFLSPSYYTVVEPLAELIDVQNPPKYKGYNWGKFFATRKRSNFQKLKVENIQIYHFKIPNKLTDDAVSGVENLVI